MMTLDEAIKFMKTWEPSFDERDRARFALFLPFERLAETGLQAKEGITAENWGEVRPWTEQEILKQLEEDVLFGIEKARDQRGLSSEAMFYVVNMWCHILQNGLQEEDYNDYGLSFHLKVLNHYGWKEQ